MNSSNEPPLPDFDLSLRAARARPRKLKMSWSLDNYYRFGEGDWVWNTKTDRPGTVVGRMGVEDVLTHESDVVYDVEDMMTGECDKLSDQELEGPFNGMEVLARVRGMS